jgi:hypothetical protein
VRENFEFRQRCILHGDICTRSKYHTCTNWVQTNSGLWNTVMYLIKLQRGTATTCTKEGKWPILPIDLPYRYRPIAIALYRSTGSISWFSRLSRIFDSCDCLGTPRQWRRLLRKAVSLSLVDQWKIANAVSKDAWEKIADLRLVRLLRKTAVLVRKMVTPEFLDKILWMSHRLCEVGPFAEGIRTL